MALPSFIPLPPDFCTSLPTPSPPSVPFHSYTHYPASRFRVRHLRNVRETKKHIPNAYLDELEWRFNNRENPYLFRDTLLKLINSDNLEYKELVS